MGAVISAVVGGLIAVGVGLGLVNAVGATPEPVTAPYIVYGQS